MTDYPPITADDLRRVQSCSYVPTPEEMADDEADARRLDDHDEQEEPRG